MVLTHANLDSAPPAIIRTFQCARCFKYYLRSWRAGYITIVGRAADDRTLPVCSIVVDGRYKQVPGVYTDMAGNFYSCDTNEQLTRESDWYACTGDTVWTEADVAEFFAFACED